MSPTRTVRQGSSLALPALVPTGTSAHPLRDAVPRGRALLPKVHINAGHHTTLAPVVGIANIVQEVRTGTNKAS